MGSERFTCLVEGEETMAQCDAAHMVFDPQVGKDIRVGELPEWTCVVGKVAYMVLRGSYDQLPGAWASFPERVLGAARSEPRGPPGDVYVCGPMDHPSDPSRMLTILYLPIR